MDKLKHFLIDLRELYIPAGRRIPYRVFVVALVVVVLIITASSVIRSPNLISPAANSQISRTPVFRFTPVKNLFYKDYNVELRYAGERVEILTSVFEEGEIVVVTTPGTLRKRADIELLITINKGLGPIKLWDKTFTYSFKTST